MINSKTVKNVFSIALLIWGISFILLYYLRLEILFLFSIFLRAVSTSIISVCYTWLISKIFIKKRFEKISNLAIIYTFITLIATISSSILIKEFSYPAIVFYIPFITSIFSIIILQKIEIKDVKEKRVEISKTLNNIQKYISKILKNNRLKNYALSLFVFYFSVGIAGIFFSIFLKKVLKLSEFEWALLTSIEMISFLIFSTPLKKVKRKFSLTSLFQISSFIISLIPLVWVVSKNFIIIISFSFIAGLAWQLFSISNLTYLTKNFKDATKISFANIFSSLGLMIGNLIGGILAEINLEYVFYISFLFRFFSSFLFVKLISTQKISFANAHQTIFLSLDFFSSLLKEFVIQFKFLAPYNHKKNTHKF